MSAADRLSTSCFASRSTVEIGNSSPVGTPVSVGTRLPSRSFCSSCSVMLTAHRPTCLRPGFPKALKLFDDRRNQDTCHLPAANSRASAVVAPPDQSQPFNNKRVSAQSRGTLFYFGIGIIGTVSEIVFVRISGKYTDSREFIAQLAAGDF